MNTRCWMETICATIFWCQARVPPLLPPFFNLPEWRRQPGWRGAGRDHGHSQFYSDPPADDLSLTSTDHNELQTMLTNWELRPKEVLDSKHPEVCGNMLQLQAWKFCASPFLSGTQLPYTDTFKYLGMVCDRQVNMDIAADAALRPFMAGTFRVKQFVKSHDLANRL